MFDENQLVKTKWNSKTKKYYEDKGYTYTKIGDEFYVKAKDLTPSSHEKIEVKCDLCGKLIYPRMIDYSKRENDFIDSCDECKPYKTRYLVFLRERKEKFRLLKEICMEKDYELITDESEYEGIKMSVSYVCKKHVEQTQQLQVLLRGGECPICARERQAKGLMFSPEYITSTINSINGNVLLNVEEYTLSKRSNLRIICGLCGNEFKSSFDAYVNLGQIRCPACSKKESKPEMKIRLFLEEHKIEFEKEKRFEDCRDKKTLPFDFYLPKYNMCIEFDGQQHYEPRFGEEGHIRTVKHDAIKNKYCQSNNIKLLRIPYWKGSKINEILVKELNL